MFLTKKNNHILNKGKAPQKKKPLGGSLLFIQAGKTKKILQHRPILISPISLLTK